MSLFRKLQGRLYGAMDLKPVLYQDVRQLDTGEVKAEEIRRNSLLKEVKRKKLQHSCSAPLFDSYATDIVLYISAGAKCHFK